MWPPGSAATVCPARLYPDPWPFDLETGMRVASKVGNLPNLGTLRPLRSRISLFAVYAMDERSDKSNAYSSSRMRVMSHETASSSAECSRDKPPFSFVRGQDSTMWDIDWVSPQGHISVSVSRHFLLHAPQCPSVRKRFSRDHCCQGRSKSDWRIVGSHTRWELTTWADFQLCLHLLLMSTGCKSATTAFWMSVVAMVG